MDIAIDGTHPLFDRDDVHEIYRGWRGVFDEYDPPRTAVAEAWVPAERRVLYAQPDELGQAFEFDLLKADWDAAQFREVIVDSLGAAPRPAPPRPGCSRTTTSCATRAASGCPRAPT